MSLIRKLSGNLAYILLAVFIIGFFVVSSILVLKYQLPFRPFNSDIYHELAVLKEFDASPHLHDPFFAAGPADLHAGPYYYMIYLLAQVIGQSHYACLLLMTCINIAFVQIALYFFARSFKMTTAQGLILVILSMLGWGSFTFFFAGIYDYANLLVSGAFPSTVGIGLLLINIGVMRRYFDTRQNALLPLFTILLSSLVLSHLLSGIILLSFIFLLLVEEYTAYRRLTLPILYACIAGAVGLLLCFFIWPPFSLISLFSQAKTIQVGNPSQVRENLFSLSHWISNLGFTIIGFVFLPKLIKQRRYFLVLIIAISALMALSYLLPVRVTLYWRYFPFMFLGLSVALAIWLGELNRRLAVMVVVLIATLGIANLGNRVTLLTAYPDPATGQYNELASYLEKGSVVFSDPNTSYHLAALHDVRVVSVPYNHANPAFIPQSKIRYDSTMHLLQSIPDANQQRAFFHQYHVRYVVINPDYYPDYISLLPDKAWTDRFELKVPARRLAQAQGLQLFELEPEAK